MDLAGLEQDPKTKISIQFIHITWKETDFICINPNYFHKRQEAAGWVQVRSRFGSLF